MTYFSPNPISSPHPFGATPPRNPREAADAIMAYLDREAASAAIPRTPFAPFLAETYEPTVVGGESGYEPAAPVPFDTPDPFLVDEEEEEPTLALLYPDAQTDDERIENVMWLLEQRPVVPMSDQPTGETPPISLANLFGLIGSANAQARGGWGKPPSVRLNPETLAPEELPLPDLPPSPQDLFRRWTYNRARKAVQTLEPNNPVLQSNPLLSGVPSVAEIEAIEAEERAATDRAKRKGLFQTKRGGESRETIGGRAAHHEFTINTKAPDRANVPIGDGRADRLRVDEAQRNAHVTELKSDRPASIRRGTRQAARYARVHEEIRGIPTTSSVETYNLVDFILRMLGKK